MSMTSKQSKIDAGLMVYIDKKLKKRFSQACTEDKTTIKFRVEQLLAEWLELRFRKKPPKHK